MVDPVIGGTEFVFEPVLTKFDHLPIAIPGITNPGWEESASGASFAVAIPSGFVMCTYGEWWGNTAPYPDNYALIARQYDSSANPVGGWITLAEIDGQTEGSMGSSWASGGSEKFFNTEGIHYHAESDCVVITQMEYWDSGTYYDRTKARIFTLKATSGGLTIVDEVEFQSLISFQTGNNFVRLSENGSGFVSAHAGGWYPLGEDEITANWDSGLRFFAFWINSDGSITYHGVHEVLYDDDWGNLVTTITRSDTQATMYWHIDSPTYTHYVIDVTITATGASYDGQWVNNGWFSMTVGEVWGQLQASRAQTWIGGKNAFSAITVNMDWNDGDGWKPGTLPGFFVYKDPDEYLLNSTAKWGSVHTYESYNAYNWPDTKYAEYGWPPESPSPYNPANWSNFNINPDEYLQMALGGKHLSLTVQSMLDESWSIAGSSYARIPYTLTHFLTTDTFGSTKWSQFYPETEFTYKSSYYISLQQFALVSIGAKPFAFWREDYEYVNDAAGGFYICELPWGVSEPPPLKMSYRDDDKRAGARRLAYDSENSGDIRLGRVAW